MSLSENDIRSELSYAYLHAVAARAGFGCEYAGRHTDNAGVDAYLRVKERFTTDSIHTNFPIEVQLKSTSAKTPFEAGRFSYWLKDVERYEELRQRNSPLPKLLAVLFLPDDPVLWLVQSENELIARRCLYWVSLWDAPACTNRTGQTIYLPQSNIVSVEGLRNLASRLSLGEELTYAQ